MSLEHAQKWCDALGNDTDALRELYADWFTLEHTMMDDHMEDTITDTDMLQAALGAIASGENGKYTFTATEWCGGRSDYGLIHWDVTIEGAKTFRGLPVPEGKTLTGCGSTFHMLDENGKVRFESTRLGGRPDPDPARGADRPPALLARGLRHGGVSRGAGWLARAASGSDRLPPRPERSQSGRATRRGRFVVQSSEGA